METTLFEKWTELKKLFIDAGDPPTVRDCVLFLAGADAAINVVGNGVAAHTVATEIEVAGRAIARQERLI